MISVDTIVTQFVDVGGESLKTMYTALAGSAGTYEGRLERMRARQTVALGSGIALAGGLAMIGAAGLKASGDMQRVEAGLTGILGSKEAATAKIAELQKFAAETPFDFQETAAASQQLLAMGFTADKLIPTLHAVGNAVATAGGGTEQFRGVLLALGQIQTKGKLSQEEMLQMAERGIPVFQILKKELGLTQEQLGNLGNQGIAADKAINALLKGMGQVGGGKGLENMAQTLPGQLSNLGDIAKQTAASFGNLFNTDATKLVSSVSDLLENTNDFIKTHPALVKTLTYMGGAAALGAIGFGVTGKVAGLFNEIAEAKNNLAGATKLDDAAEKAKAVTAITEAGAITKVGTAATGTASKLSLLARTQAFLGRSAFGRGALGVAGRVGVGGATAAAGAGMLGIAAGYGAYDDLSNLGLDEARAKIAGSATGVAAAIAMFIPGVREAALAATALRIGLNELVNKPMEKKAEEGSGANEEEQKKLLAAKTPEERAKIYEDIAKRKMDEALNPTWQQKLSEFMDRTRGVRNPMAGVDQDKWDDAMTAQAQAEAQKRIAAGVGAGPPGATEHNPNSEYWKKMKADERARQAAINTRSSANTERNGSKTIRFEAKLPADSADQMSSDQAAYEYAF